jgi:hypothetical protein
LNLRFEDETPKDKAHQKQSVDHNTQTISDKNSAEKPHGKERTHEVVEEKVEENENKG